VQASATRSGARPAPAARYQSAPAASIGNQPDCPAAKRATPRIGTGGAAGPSPQVSRVAVAAQRETGVLTRAGLDEVGERGLHAGLGSL
jgi:hypothetical protein